MWDSCVYGQLRITTSLWQKWTNVPPTKNPFLLMLSLVLIVAL